MDVILKGLVKGAVCCGMGRNVVGSDELKVASRVVLGLLLWLLL
jgi:hypothetical protein